MNRVHITARNWVLLVPLAFLPVHSQDVQFLPDVEVNYKFYSGLRVTFGVDHDIGNPQQYELSPSIQFHLKPLIRLRKVTEFDLDDSKSRFLVAQIGFQYLIPPGHAATTNRLPAMVTSNYPLSGGLLISDR